MTDKSTPEQTLLYRYKLLLKQTKTLKKALVAAADCIDILARAAIDAKYEIDKLCATWDAPEELGELGEPWPYSPILDDWPLQSIESN